MKKIMLLSIVTAVSLFAANYAPCAGCHGVDGSKKALGKSAVIKGWDVAKVEAALKRL